MITVRYWAAARAAAGVDDDQFDTLPADPASLRARLAAAHPDLAPVLAVSTLLVDGIAQPAAADRPGDYSDLIGGSVVEVLPPFAGG